MALSLDATVGGANSNSYADVAAADTAATYRVGANAAAWAALTPDQKIQALVTATRDIDTLEGQRLDDWGFSFIGDRATDTQALEWPRSGTQYPDDELPSTLVEATIELAISYVPSFAAGATDVLNTNASDARIKRKKLDVMETEWFAPGPAGVALERFPTMVQRLLAPLLEWVPVGLGGLWGEGSAIRGS